MAERLMRDSGVEWIGCIPSAWKIKRVKAEFISHKDIVGEKVNDYERLALTLNGVIRRSKEDDQGLQPEKFDGYQILRKNELVFKLIDLENVNTSRVGLSPYDGIVSPAYIVLKQRNRFSTKYAEYFFLSMWQREVFNHLGDDGVRSSLNASDLLNVPMTIPSEEEQSRIADFLDKKVSEIDAVISKTKESIEEYKKLKQSIITEAVTKGLDPDVEMKDSGNEFVGRIPKHWDVKRTRFIADSLKKGNGITKEEVFPDGDIPCVRYGEIYTKYNDGFINCVSKTKLEKISKPSYFSHGDLLFCGTGELVEEIGKNIVYLGSEECLAGGDIIVMKHNQDPLFMNYALNSTYSQTQKSYGKAKLKVVHISASEIGNIWIAIPPIDEQRRISEHLSDNCSRLNDVISKKEQVITELEQYKKSLIYEYVTGKKEVA